MTPAELHPTPHRRWLAATIDAGLVRHYHHRKPVTRRATVSGQPHVGVITADVAAFVRHGIARLGVAEPGAYSTVRLTPAGQQWLADAGGAP